MNKQTFETVANVKKMATQASKGGTIVLTLEMPLTDENALLAGAQSKDCVMTLRFDNNSIETARGQMELDFDGPGHTAEIIKKDDDVGFEYIDDEGDVVNEGIEEE